MAGTRTGRVRITTGGSGGGGGAPSGSAGGSLTGTYPNPTIATIPSGATATTQAATDGSTKVATTAYTDTADALKANLASPTFTGTPTLPTGTVGTTQSAADSSTKLATTAFTTTADNLKANLAGPTFTGTVTLPSTTVAVTPSASDNSTKPATTAYVDTADALKANLASPTFSGTPSLPTGTTASTQSINDASTKLATTAYITAQTKATGGCYQIGPNAYANMPVMQAAVASSVPNAGDGRWTRVMMGQSGVLHDVSFLTATTGNNYNILVLDDGQANGTHTVRTCLAIKGATATPSTGTWVTLDPSLTVAAGDTLVFMWTGSTTTPQMYSAGGGTGAGLLPSTSFFTGSGAATTSQKVSGSTLSANVPAAVNGTVTDANMSTLANMPYCVWRIT